MKLNEQQREQLRQLFPASYPTFSKPVLWMLRAVLLILVTLWIAGGLYLNNQVKQDEQRIEQARIEANRRDEFLRRGAKYKQAMQQRTQASQTRNALDNL